MNLLSGGCLCQNVQYKIFGKPISQGICYCQHCQKSASAYASPLLVLKAENFECPQTHLSFYITESSRGSKIKRYFCKECGSPLFSQISDIPGIVTVKALTLHDTSFFKPEYLVWTKSLADFCQLPQNVPAFLENAPFGLLLKS